MLTLITVKHLILNRGPPAATRRWCQMQAFRMRPRTANHAHRPTVCLPRRKQTCLIFVSQVSTRSRIPRTKRELRRCIRLNGYSESESYQPPLRDLRGAGPIMVWICTEWSSGRSRVVFNEGA